MPSVPVSTLSVPALNIFFDERAKASVIPSTTFPFLILVDDTEPEAPAEALTAVAAPGPAAVAAAAPPPAADTAAPGWAWTNCHES